MTSLVDSLARRMAEMTGKPVDRFETHISWVLLSGDVAWKLKKPVRLSFLDFSTLAARRRYCHEEVRLNQRLAPSLYQGVLAVTGTIDAPRVAQATPDAETVGGREAATGGDAGTRTGPVLDYLVLMRRFPAGALFAERLAAGRLAVDDVTGLARRLARFHETAAVQDDPALANAVARQAMQACDQLRLLAVRHARDGEVAVVDRIAGWLAVEATRLQPRFKRRMRTGRVRDIHGDLHLNNALVLDDGPTAFDCLEFDAALRRIDVIGDPAFLAMDLAAHGRDDLANLLIDAWCEAANDHEAVALLAFHRVYRAAVRALVAWLAPVPATAMAERYLRTAERLVEAARRPPTLTITHGPSGSGKSVAAERLVAADGGLRLRSDVERKRLAGLEPLADSQAVGLNLYTPEASARTYERLAALAERVLAAGSPVVVDAAFLKRAERRRFADLAARHGVRWRIIDCRADPLVLEQRIVSRAAARQDPSEATVAVLRRQLASVEPLGADECQQGQVVEADTILRAPR